MRRKATNKTRSANADEKRFMKWVKESPCCQCGDTQVVVDHMYGSTFKHNKVLIGHWALLPLCLECDRVKTLGSHNAYLEVFQQTQAQAWAKLIENAPAAIPDEVINAISEWGR